MHGQQVVNCVYFHQARSEHIHRSYRHYHYQLRRYDRHRCGSVCFGYCFCLSRCIHFFFEYHPCRHFYCHRGVFFFSKYAVITLLYFIFTCVVTWEHAYCYTLSFLDFGCVFLCRCCDFPRSWDCIFLFFFLSVLLWVQGPLVPQRRPCVGYI